MNYERMKSNQDGPFLSLSISRASKRWLVSRARFKNGWLAEDRYCLEIGSEFPVYMEVTRPQVRDFREACAFNFLLSFFGPLYNMFQSQPITVCIVRTVVYLN
ncbi:unnamed protein product [Calypogeia fissa]